MNEQFEKLSHWIEESLFLSTGFQKHLINSIIIIILFVIFHYILLMIVNKQTKDIKRQYHWRKGITYTLTILAIFLIGRIWFRGFQSFAIFSGIFAAGIAITLQDLLVNMAGWLFIVWRRPFDVGDRVEINNHTGDVIDQRPFMFTLMEVGNWVAADQSTGRIIHLPNGWIFKHSLANYSRGFYYIWNELPVLVTFESNWEKAKTILAAIANKHAEHLSGEAEKRVKRAAKRYMIFFSKLTPIVWTSVEDSGVLLTIRYLCDPRRRRGSSEAIWEDILRQFAACDDIDFAYPTTRFYNNQQEGKPKAGRLNPD